MATTKVNKSEAIRDALKSHPEKAPMEIAALLKLVGVKVTPTYVSNVKFHTENGRGRKRKTLTVRGTARRTKGKASVSSFSSLHSALDFIRAAGGIEHAKAALQTLEQVREALG